ncbi:MAG: FKBP-type peptidyl-prolyl cis-trans isomerase [Chitinophagaceae bacterium]|jgi:FKBP-type peptidyl-prolyl cis-trans isomerase|nr:FKBP-type peptidyl-prolyl cis-trans isomerase [Chitinophagaceae bacterium]
MKQVLFAVAVLAVIGGCRQLNYQKNKAGLLYKIFPAKERGDSLKANDLIKYSYTFITKDAKGKDTIFAQSAERGVNYGKVDTSTDVRALLSPAAPFSYARVGDSIELIVSIDSLAKQNLIQYNGVFRKGNNIIARMHILKKFKDEKEMSDDRQKEMEAAMAREQEKEKAQQKAEIDSLKKSGTLDKQNKEVEDFLAKKNITATKTPLGEYVMIEKPGSDTAVEDGKYITIKYTGKRLDTDSTFESNQFTVKLGKQPLIPGFEDGLRAFKQGGKGAIYIPGY